MYKIESERGDLFDINMMIAMQIKVSGKSFSEKEIAEAFNDSISAFEILNCKIIIDNGGNAFYDNCPQSQNNINFKDFQLAELIQEQERLRFKLENGEFLRCFVSLSDNNEMKACFLMHHLGGDGKSLCYFIEAFLKRLNGEKTQYRKAIFFEKEELKDIKLPFWASLLTKKYNKEWQKESRVFDFEDMQKAYEQFWQTHKTIVRNEATESEELNQKLSECKANKIGFTSYSIAEIIKDIPSKQDIGLAVDGRLDGNRTMSNQATGISVKYAYNNRYTLIDNAKAIDKMMKKKLQNKNNKYFILRFMSEFEPTLLDAVNLEFTGYFHSKTSAELARLLGYGQNTKDFSITNLTRLDIPTEYGDYKLTDFIFAPPVISYGKNIVGMATVNGHLNTTYHNYQQDK
ncbi:MAG: hypothetical protein K5917_06175 [Clostridiales bacterium]|nr:hypothetical protein [Clostridiales bacterium]